MADCAVAVTALWEALEAPWQRQVAMQHALRSELEDLYLRQHLAPPQGVLHYDIEARRMQAGPL